jgi:hypothetical protein
MESESKPKLVLEAGQEGKGRPKVEWEEYVEGLVRKRGRKLPEVRRLAQYTDEYRKRLLKPDASHQKGLMKKKFLQPGNTIQISATLSTLLKLIN